MKPIFTVLTLALFLTLPLTAHAAGECENTEAEDLLKSLKAVNADFGSEAFFSCLAPKTREHESFLMFSKVIFDIKANDKTLPPFFAGHNLPNDLPSSEANEWRDYYKDLRDPAGLYQDLYNATQKLESEAQFTKCENHQLSLETEQQGFIQMTCTGKDGHNTPIGYLIQHQYDGWYILGLAQ